MNSFKGFVTKEFKQIFRDKRTLVVLFGMPVIMLILFGFALRNEINNAQIAVLDLSKDAVTRDLTQKLASSEAFQLNTYLHNYDEVEEVFKSGVVKEIVVFEKKFAQRLTREGIANVQVITDATDPNLANIVQSYTGAIIRDYTQELNYQGKVLEQGIQPVIKMMYNPELKSVNLFVPGLIAVILMLVSALMTSISITREKEMGNMEILLVSPLKPIHIIIGKVLPYLVLSVINVITILVLAHYIFEVPFKGSYALFFGEAILFILTALALGVFISSVTNNQQTAMMISLAGLLLPTVLLSGFIFPVESMPAPLQMVSHAIPAKWFLIVVRSIMLKGSGIEFLWMETLILVGIAMFFMTLSLKKFNVRLQ
ncbi:MAG: ABC transporter permease [Balneolaceae bacterium]|nr:ABC transporter permease [Balneolaceae bacterium]MBO6547664.1 ABC transporter permease [Balneolaceae bacterium]MBO6648175.1 ABC transporter permease [Balneolaceae bacterium]